MLHGPKDSEALTFLSKFCEWIKYEHRVRALLSNGSSTVLPINRQTLEDIFDVKFKNEMEVKSFLDNIRNKELKPRNTDEFFESQIGNKLADIFFRPYTKKMWGTEPKNLSIGIGSRLPIRINYDDRYFNDSFQALPKNGYKNLIENIFDHKNINVKLNCVFDKRMQKFYNHSFLCIPIDSYYNFKFGRLTYRSILFENHLVQRDDLPSPVLNFTNNSKYTRMTQWSLLPNSGKTKTNKKTFTYEIPCSMETNPNEYYYPVQTKESKVLYQKYSKLSKTDHEITFCGRTGLFKYLDMLPCVLLHMRIAKDFLKVIKK